MVCTRTALYRVRIASDSCMALEMLSVRVLTVCCTALAGPVRSVRTTIKAKTIWDNKP